MRIMKYYVENKALFETFYDINDTQLGELLWVNGF